MQLSLDEVAPAIRINTARVWTARAQRELTDVQLGEMMSVPVSVIRSLQLEDQECRVTPEQLTALVEALQFPAKFFQEGDQVQEWKGHHETRQWLEKTQPGFAPRKKRTP